jgi:hypothetical protein
VTRHDLDQSNNRAGAGKYLSRHGYSRGIAEGY